MAEGQRTALHSAARTTKEPPMNEVPVKRYQLMKRRFPALMSAVEQLGEAAAGAGPLDEKTKELVQLGAAAARAPREPCTATRGARSSSARARTTSATR